MEGLQDTFLELGFSSLATIIDKQLLFFFFLNPELTFNFLNFIKRKEKYPGGGERVAQERLWTSKTLKNLLMR